MKRYILVAAVIICAILAGFLFLHKKSPLLPPKNQTIVAFGDSLVAGYGATSGHDFVSVLSQTLGVEIVNKGVSGDTTAASLARIDEVLALDPGIVIVLLGGNDYLQRVPKDITFQNLGKIVSKFKQNNTRVVLLGVRGGLLKDNYESTFSSFARANDLIYVKNVLDGILGQPDLMSDEVHPNDRGYAKIAAKVLPALQSAM